MRDKCSAITNKDQCVVWESCKWNDNYVKEKAFNKCSNSATMISSMDGKNE